MAFNSQATAYAHSFTWRLIWRLGAVFAMGIAIAWATQRPVTHVTITVLLLLIGLLLADVLRLIQRTNLEVTRLVSALQHSDFSQTFRAATPDAGFPELGVALDQLMSHQRKQMNDVRTQASHLASLIDHVPIPLLTIDSNDNVDLLNNAARRLFNRRHGRRLADFAVYGDSVVAELRKTVPTQTIRLSPPDDAASHMRMTQTQINRMGQQQRLVALQPIQSDLDATELALSRGLVRVLTHEIMNSLTPVTSLAKSAAAMSSTLPKSNIGDDIRIAIETVERRAEGLMQFVGRYREITGSIELEREIFSLASSFHDLELLFRTEWSEEKLSLHIDIQPLDLQLNADRELLEQVVINLLRNAAQASIDFCASPIVSIRARTARSGGVLIDIEDNGPGIPESLRKDVFLPFFTTKAGGSGIGLSVARQVVLAHGGSIRIESSSTGGACLRIVL